MIFLWAVGGREFADQWAGRPLGLEEAVRRAVRVFEAQQQARLARAYANWMEREKFAAHMIPARSLIRVWGA